MSLSCEPHGLRFDVLKPDKGQFWFFRWQNTNARWFDDLTKRSSNPSNWQSFRHRNAQIPRGRLIPQCLYLLWVYRATWEKPTRLAGSAHTPSLLFSTLRGSGIWHCAPSLHQEIHQAAIRAIAFLICGKLAVS
jgi:hypothetical protein